MEIIVKKDDDVFKPKKIQDNCDGILKRKVNFQVRDTCKRSKIINKLTRIKSNHMKSCKMLRVQSRYDSSMFNTLNKSKYIVYGNKKFDDNGKKIKQDVNTILYPIRLTFFNGGTARFPYQFWKNIWIERSKDISNDVVLFDNEFARSEEGVKLFFELDYRSESDEPDYIRIMDDVKICQDVTRDFFKSNENVNLSLWVLMSTPKIKHSSKSTEPIIAMGCHVIFQNIVINCEQGKQLCHSVNMRIESIRNEKNVVDSACYKNEIACLRPIYGRKIESCLSCNNDENIRFGCNECNSRGRKVSGSFYKPYTKLNSKGESIYNEVDFETYVKNHVLDVVVQTSIIPDKIDSVLNNGYKIPYNEPVYIPLKLRSTHRDDSGKDYIYKTDRRYISKRRKDAYSCFTDARGYRYVTELVKRMHVHYNNEHMIVSNITRNSTNIFVDLKGHGRSFCRIKQSNGHLHSSNRIYFIINKRKSEIRQCCYSDDCKIISKDINIQKSLTMSVPRKMIDYLFKVNVMKCQHKKKVSNESKKEPKTKNNNIVTDISKKCLQDKFKGDKFKSITNSYHAMSSFLKTLGT